MTYRTFKQLALVLVDAFHLHIEERRRINDRPNASFDPRRQLVFARLLHLAPLLAECCIVGKRLQFSQLVFVGDPFISDLAVMSWLSSGLLSASQRRGVTPLVTLKNFCGQNS